MSHVPQHGMLGVRAGLSRNGAVDADAAVLQVRMRLVGLLHPQLALCRDLSEKRESLRQALIRVHVHVSASARKTVQFLLRGRQSVAGFIFGSSRAAKDSGAPLC